MLQAQIYIDKDELKGMQPLHQFIMQLLIENGIAGAQPHLSGIRDLADIIALNSLHSNFHLTKRLCLSHLLTSIKK